ncbi:PHP domain-containing protein [Dethiobacter alkaliphilus]|uniref:PHP domain-containing protein n=1 Tax=Dethiobacter alkaliphilus TaxID=427926 RepID=UPI00222639A3|nr:PHP domain-containing protein [Dethiobacter alkaliphilus]MCW3488616.1 PHP domain-containing protein [Dethiobacter alkaliphilus]
MKVIADYHTHTRYSHGKGSIEDNVEAAVKRGLSTLAIADHGPGHFFIGIGGVQAFFRMQKEVASLRRKYPKLEILLGVEANIVDTDGTIDVPTVMLRELGILLVGYHKLVKVKSFDGFKQMAQNFLAGWTGSSSSRLRQINTDAIVAAVKRYPIDIITHPGLQVDIDTVALARACHQQNTFLEINSSYGEELDPFIKAAMPTGVRFVINSDAHEPGRVGDFAAAYKLVERLNIPRERIVNLEGNLSQKSRTLGA